MKAISVYTITRNQNAEQLTRLERQLSGRTYLLKIRQWELQSMKALVRRLEEYMEDVYALRFFYSFQIPRLGKEFDLLQIKEDQIINIELKSGAVSEAAVRKQLIQNRYYLSALGKPVYSYTYISSQDQLLKLTNHDHIVEGDWKLLADALHKETCDYTGDIEELFQAELYLISPLTEPERFLQKEYFLTSQQRDIERQILKKISGERMGYFWFTGLPGTGKTLLLYDIAMKLSRRQKVCMIHCGETGKKWQILHERLRRIDFLSDSQLENDSQLEGYSSFLIDEAHLLSKEKLKILLQAGKGYPIIFSSDNEDIISLEEMDHGTTEILENLPDIHIFHLTNRIRTNAELSSFILNIMHMPDKKVPRYYPHIEVVCANDQREAENLLKDYLRQGYQYFSKKEESFHNIQRENTVETAAVQDTERLVLLLDASYYYDEKGYLRAADSVNNEKSQVRNLFHQLNQAKEKIALIVKNNETVYENMLELLQSKNKIKK